jgi:hypothetical protein
MEFQHPECLHPRVVGKLEGLNPKKKKPLKTIIFKFINSIIHISSFVRIIYIYIYIKVHFLVTRLFK